MKTFYLLILIDLTIVGCGGMRILVEGPDVQYPVSFTENIFDDELHILTANDYMIIDSFKISRTRYGILFGYLSFGGSIDISKDLNQLIVQSSADGIINLRYDYFMPALGVTAYMLSLIPAGYSTVGLIGNSIPFINIASGYIVSLLIPQSLSVEVSGLLIKRRKL